MINALDIQGFMLNTQCQFQFSWSGLCLNPQAEFNLQCGACICSSKLEFDSLLNHHIVDGDKDSERDDT